MVRSFPAPSGISKTAGRAQRKMDAKWYLGNAFRKTSILQQGAAAKWVRLPPCSVLRAPCSVLRAPCSVLRAVTPPCRGAATPSRHDAAMPPRCHATAPPRRRAVTPRRRHTTTPPSRAPCRTAPRSFIDIKPPCILSSLVCESPYKWFWTAFVKTSGQGVLSTLTDKLRPPTKLCIKIDQDTGIIRGKFGLVIRFVPVRLRRRRRDVSNPSYEGRGKGDVCEELPCFVVCSPTPRP